MAGRHGQHELGAGSSKFSPRKFSEKIALLNKKEAEGNAEFEEIIKEVQATTKRGASAAQTRQAAAAAADDELEEVYQNLMSCQYDEDQDQADSSSEVSSGARDQIEDIERSIREDAAAPVVMGQHCYALKLGAGKPTPGGFAFGAGCCRLRGTSAGALQHQQHVEAQAYCSGWQAAPANDYLKPERLQWQKSSSDPALNSASHKLAPSPLLQATGPAPSIHGSCSENYIQLDGCSYLEQRRDLPGIKICAIEEPEATSQPVLCDDKPNSSLPDIAKLQFSGDGANQWPANHQPVDFGEQQQQQQAVWMAPEVFEPKPVNSLLSSSECGLQAACRRLNQQPAQHQQRCPKASYQEQIIRSHSHNSISLSHQHQHHGQHYEQHQFAHQAGCARHLDEAKSASSGNSVRPQYGSISPINSPQSQPTSPQSEAQADSCPPYYPCALGQQPLYAGQQLFVEQQQQQQQQCQQEEDITQQCIYRCI